MNELSAAFSSFVEGIPEMALLLSSDANIDLKWNKIFIFSTFYRID